MKKSNSIVRVITIYNKNKDNTHYEIDFMTYKKALYFINDRIGFKDVEKKIYPFKWYDIRYLYQIPAYWLLLRAFRNSEDKISKQRHNAVSTITLITEMLLAIKPIIEFVKLFISN